jgi:DUF1365 family protein
MSEDADSRHMSAAYILESKVWHARHLPKESAHSFTYPTLSLLLSLSHLESHALDIGGSALFGYNPSDTRFSRVRLAGIRPGAYLQDVEAELNVGARLSRGGLTSHDGKERFTTIRRKLVQVLCRFGHDSELLAGVWMLTMPSYMGVEGINPLTVYYCYKKDEETVWIVVLEVSFISL